MILTRSWFVTLILTVALATTYQSQADTAPVSVTVFTPYITPKTFEDFESATRSCRIPELAGPAQNGLSELKHISRTMDIYTDALSDAHNTGFTAEFIAFGADIAGIMAIAKTFMILSKALGKAVKDLGYSLAQMQEALNVAKAEPFTETKGALNRAIEGLRQSLYDKEESIKQAVNLMEGRGGMRLTYSNTPYPELNVSKEEAFATVRAATDAALAEASLSVSTALAAETASSRGLVVLAYYLGRSQQLVSTLEQTLHFMGNASLVRTAAAFGWIAQGHLLKEGRAIGIEVENELTLFDAAYSDYPSDLRVFADQKCNSALSQATAYEHKRYASYQWDQSYHFAGMDEIKHAQAEVEAAESCLNSYSTSFALIKQFLTDTLAICHSPEIELALTLNK